MTIREYRDEDIMSMAEIWNEVVEEGNAFPQEEILTYETAYEFFKKQTRCGVSEDDGNIVGLYILHQDGEGRCSHICNASYAVKSEFRGRGIGEMLVKDCICRAKLHNFRVLRFNAVVISNVYARHLYERLGFIPLGVIRGGFRRKDGAYEDIMPYYMEF